MLLFQHNPHCLTEYRYQATRLRLITLLMNKLLRSIMLIIVTTRQLLVPRQSMVRLVNKYQLPLMYQQTGKSLADNKCHNRSHSGQPQLAIRRSMLNIRQKMLLTIQVKRIRRIKSLITRLLKTLTVLKQPLQQQPYHLNGLLPKTW